MVSMTTTRRENKVMKTCDICGKVMLARGMGGHMSGVHGVRQGVRVQLDETLTRLDRIEAVVNNLAKGLCSSGRVVALESDDGKVKRKGKQVYWCDPEQKPAPESKPARGSGLTDVQLGQAVDSMVAWKARQRQE